MTLTWHSLTQLNPTRFYKLHEPLNYIFIQARIKNVISEHYDYLDIIKNYWQDLQWIIFVHLGICLPFNIKIWVFLPLLPTNMRLQCSSQSWSSLIAQCRRHLLQELQTKEEWAKCLYVKVQLFSTRSHPIGSLKFPAAALRAPGEKSLQVTWMKCSTVY